MIKIYIFILISITSILQADSKSLYETIGKKYNIDAKVISSLAEIESKQNQYAVGLMSKSNEHTLDAAYALDYYHIKNSVAKNLKTIQVRSKTKKEALIAISIAEKLGLDYDVGLMQINRRNIISLNLDINHLLSSKTYNIETGIYILNQCFNKFDNDLPKGFECYNKGTNSKKFDYGYAKRFYLEYQNQIASE